MLAAVPASIQLRFLVFDLLYVATPAVWVYPLTARPTDSPKILNRRLFGQQHFMKLKSESGILAPHFTPS
ncbi:MAG: hypothetical protein M2R45_01618 [Verrucomicrobia subdivision 3 bacterium]|nr:hypothetical protein [Limisphaerales bacterium]